MPYQQPAPKPSKHGDWDTWGDSIDAIARQVVTDVPPTLTDVADLAGRVAAAEAAIAAKADLAGLAPVATSGAYGDLSGAPQSGVMATSSTTARPTADPQVVVAWHTPTPPVSLMLARDYWVPTPA